MRLWIIFLTSLITVSKCHDENTADIFDKPHGGHRAEPTDLRTDVLELENEGSDSFEVSTAMVELTSKTSNTTQAANSEENVSVEPLELTTKFIDSSTSENKSGSTPTEAALPPIIQLVVGEETEPLQTTTRSTSATTQPLPEEVMVADPFTITEPTHIIETTIATEAPVDVHTNIQTHMQRETEPLVLENKTESRSTVQKQNEANPPSSESGDETTFATVNIVPTDTPILPHQLTLEQRVLKEKEKMSEVSQPESKNLSIKDQLDVEPLIDEDITTAAETPITELTESTTTNRDIIEIVTTGLMEEDSELAIIATSTAESTLQKMKSANDLNKMAMENEEVRMKPTIARSTTEETSETDGEGEPFDQEKFSGLFEPNGSVIPSDHVHNQPDEFDKPAFPILHLPDDNAKKEHVEVTINQPTTTSSPKLDFTIKATVSTMRTESEAPTTLATTTTTAEELVAGRSSPTTSTTEHLHEPLDLNILPSAIETNEGDTFAHTEEPNLEEHDHMIRLPKFRQQGEFDPKIDVEHNPVPVTKQITDPKISTLTIKITSIDYMEEFADKESGKYKKLSEQIRPEISAILQSILGNQFVGFEIVSFSKGSVIVNGIILTNSDIQDAEDLATKIDTVISSNGSTIGGNNVDSRSTTVNEVPSRAYINKVHSSHTSSSSSTLLIGTIIVVGVVVILIVAVIIIVMNNRRSNGTMKLRDDHLQRLESGKTAYANPQAVNLMTYANGGAPPSPSNQPPMVIMGSQMMHKSSIYHF